MNPHVLIGIDLAAKTFAAAYRGADGNAVVKEFLNTSKGHGSFVELVRRWPGKVRVCMEWTGNYGLDLAVRLHEGELAEVMMVNPQTAHRFHQATMCRAKTDKADANSLLEFGERMEFRPWDPPRSAVMELRAISRRIFGLTKACTREKNALHAAKATKSTPKAVLEDLQLGIEQIGKRIDGLEAQAQEIAAADDFIAPKLKVVTTPKGVAKRSGVAVLAELLTLPTHLTSRQVTAYAGLDPRTVESGTSVRRRGAITKRGNARLRSALYMPALTAIRHEPAIRAFYLRLVARGKQPKAAVVAVMRRLLVALWAMLQSGEAFNSEKFTPSVRKAA